MKRSLLLFASLLGTTVSSVARADGEVLVVDVVTTTKGVDVAHLRSAIGRELHVQAVDPTDARASNAAASRITIDTSGSNLSVRYAKAGAKETIARSVALPEGVERIEASAVILASNVARDEASDLIGTLKKSAPPNKLPTPSAKQVEGLGVLDDGVRAYEKGAKDYRDTVTSIVRLHFETKKKEVLAGLDREIKTEKTELAKARETARRRLEEFISAYGNLPKHEAVADAMFRLAALYEEKEGGTGLDHAIRLYERIIREHPTYRERAAVLYFLGHALTEAGKIRDGQHAWRALVCPNHFSYPARGDAPQDHDEAYWKDWRRKYNDPKTFSKTNPDTVFVDIYPSDCTSPESKYLAEAWWQIGNWEFDQLDFAAGPWAINRAASAYAHAMAFKKPAIYGIALYKHAWALYKQQRYELATKELVQLLNHTDEQEKLTGDRSAAFGDFRREAFTYIAGSIANIDFKGPEAWEPYAPRPDVLESEANLDRAAQKLRVAIDRVKDPAIIPQDKPWTIEIYRAFAEELASLGQFGLAVEMRTAMLDKWPMDPSAPETQSAIADALDQANVSKKTGSAEYEATGRKALDARSKLSRFVGNTPWVDANKDNPTALRNAETLVRRGLRQAAVQHTNYGRAEIDRGAYAQALAEYKLAATAWQAYGRNDENTDARESRYWHADARHKIVMAQAKLHELGPKTAPPPSKSDIDEAILASITVRDGESQTSAATTTDVFAENAAFFVVDVSDVERDLAFENRSATKRVDVRFDGDDPATRHVVKDSIPGVVVQSMAARDDFVRVASTSASSSTRSLDYRYYVAETLFLYGHWDASKPRFESLWHEQCGVTTHGHQAWKRLVTMAAKERDENRALALAEAIDPKNKGGKSCDAAGEKEYAGPIRTEASLEKARKLLTEAEGAAAAAKARWRDVATAYEAADDAADPRSEAKLNAAYAWRRAGEAKRSVVLYEKVIAAQPAGGGPSPSPLRTNAIAHAYDGLLALHYAAFDYANAAETNARLAGSTSLEESKRRDAAKQALLIYAGLGDRDGMMEMHRVHGALHPAATERAEVDYRVQAFDYEAWRSSTTSTSPTRDALRTRATSSLLTFVHSHSLDRDVAVAAPYLVEASHGIAMMKHDARDPDARAWFARTVARWDSFASGSQSAEARKSPYVEHAAEASFMILDAEITASFDTPARHTYRGARVAEILPPSGKYAENAKLADQWDQRLDREITRKYGAAAPEWILAAIARQGQLFDTLRTGLYDTTSVKLFDARGDALVAALKASGQTQRAIDLEDAAKDSWRARKATELAGADEVMVRRYATAVATAKALNITNRAITRALGRLAYYTDILGDSAIERIVTSIPDPASKGTTKLTYTSSMYKSMQTSATAGMAQKQQHETMMSTPASP